MPEWPELTSGVIINLITEVIVVVIGVLAAQVLKRWWDEWRYGRWCAIVRRGGAELVKRAVSAGKAKEVLGEPAELSVFLKGLVSPYDTLHCDILEMDQQPGLLVIDRKTRRFVVDLDKNPPKPKNGAPAVL